MYAYILHEVHKKRNPVYILKQLLLTYMSTGERAMYVVYGVGVKESVYTVDTLCRIKLIIFCYSPLIVTDTQNYPTNAITYQPMAEPPPPSIKDISLRKARKVPTGACEPGYIIDGFSPAQPQ